MSSSPSYHRFNPFSQSRKFSFISQAMAPSSKIGIGSALVSTRIAELSDDFHNLLLLLETAGMSFILDHPCKVLFPEVEEFFQNAKVKRNGKLLKTKVRGIKIKLSTPIVSKLLRLPVIDEEDDLTDEDYDRACGFYRISVGVNTIRRPDLNPESKLLVDILRKVLLCKNNSISFITADFFDMKTTVICRKKFQFGMMIFDKIKESIKVPNYAKIISLLLHEFKLEVFDLSKGTTLHHMKEFSISFIQRWELKLKNPAQATLAHNYPEDEDRTPSSPLPQVAGTSSAVAEGEPAPSTPEERHSTPPPDDALPAATPAENLFTDAQVQEQVLSTEVEINRMIDELTLKDLILSKVRDLHKELNPLLSYFKVLLPTDISPPSWFQEVLKPGPQLKREK
ncbi:hypothetical protein KSP39_PZI004550 [Platanthera zijinensis]|uniref:Uncharacterized protein n=1 Tax=Platanthera zijinensis TaxID=2320716 RepID=A0AAP0GD16_9ASPA